MARKKTKAYKSTPFSERITYLRKRAGLTMTVLSEKMHVTPSYISLLESGERQASRAVVQKMADVFFEPRDINARDELLMLAGLSPVQTDKIVAPSDIRSTYEQALAKNPQDFRTYGALVRHLLKERQVDDARYKIHDGMRRFTRSYQLQALLAQLELSHQHFRGAETAQLAAIEQFKTAHPNDDLKDNSDFADLHTNLGMIAFLWGMHFHELEGSDPDEQAENRRQALAYFRRSRENYEQAMAIAPNDVYVLDEYARLCFSLANLSEEPERKRLWGTCIDAFMQVLATPSNHELGLDGIREACLSLAQAYQRSGRILEAELVLSVARSTSPESWQLLYASACLYSQLYESKKSAAHLDRSLAYLNMALKVQVGDNQTREKALEAPELQALRQKRRKALDELLKTGESNA